MAHIHVCALDHGSKVSSNGRGSITITCCLTKLDRNARNVVATNDVSPLAKWNLGVHVCTYDNPASLVWKIGGGVAMSKWNRNKETLPKQYRVHVGLVG